MTRRGWVLFVAMCLIWGIPYLLIKVAVRDLSPVAVVFARTAVGALLLALVVRGPQVRGLRRHWPALLAYTAIEIAIPWWLLTDAEQQVTSSLAGLLIAGVPIAAVLVVRLLDPAKAEPLDWRRVTGLLAGVAGVGALLGFDPVAPRPWPVVELGLVVICYATGPVIVARWLRDVSGLGLAVASLAICAVGYAPFAVPALPGHLPPWPVTLAVLGLGAICTAAAFPIFFALIGEVGAARTTVITFVNPAVAVLLKPLSQGPAARVRARLRLNGFAALPRSPARDRAPRHAGRLRADPGRIGPGDPAAPHSFTPNSVESASALNCVNAAFELSGRVSPFGASGESK
jgi:drug/metabolite transporter (DMT)-like permease